MYVELDGNVSSNAVKYSLSLVNPTLKPIDYIMVTNVLLSIGRYTLCGCVFNQLNVCYWNLSPLILSGFSNACEYHLL